MNVHTIGDQNQPSFKSPIRTEIYLVKMALNVIIVKQDLLNENQLGYINHLWQ